MIISVTSSKSLEELNQDFRKAVQRHKFGVLNVLACRSYALLVATGFFSF